MNCFVTGKEISRDSTPVDFLAVSISIANAPELVELANEINCTWRFEILYSWKDLRMPSAKFGYCESEGPNLRIPDWLALTSSTVKVKRMLASPFPALGTGFPPDLPPAAPRPLVGCTLTTTAGFVLPFFPLPFFPFFPLFPFFPRFGIRIGAANCSLH